MLRNYIKIAIRNLNKNKVFSLINIGGLTVGLACSMLIFLYVQDELSFDKQHDNYSNIYRLSAEYEIAPQFKTNLNFPSAFSSVALESVSGIKNSVRIENQSQTVVKLGEERIYEDGLVYTDPSFFEMFAFELESGDPETALSNPNSIVITHEIAEKYFGVEDPMGKTLLIGEDEEYTVTGITSSRTIDSHISFSMLASMSSLGEQANSWSPFPNYKTYVELHDGIVAEDLHTAMLDILVNNMGDNGKSFKALSSEPLQDIYLHVDTYVHDSLRGNIKYVKIFSIIGILILCIACINYVNLSTARASLRSMEVGVRKASGALKTQLVYQFLMESFLLTFLSSLLAIGLMEILLLGFNQITGKELQIQLFSNPELLFGLIGISLISSFLAGVYPALYLSKFKPVSTLKGEFKSGKAAIFFRKGLVTLQFVITIGLIICTLIVTKQFNFLQDKGIGVNTEALVSLPVKNDLRSNYQAFKQELLSQPDVSKVTTGPLFLGGIYFETYSEDSDVEHRPKSNTLQIFRTDYDFISTLELELLAGRDFSRDISTDYEKAVLVNETAIEEFGWVNSSDALGKEIEFGQSKYTIVGVVQDFHTFSPKSSLLPVAVHLIDEGSSQILVKLNTPNLSNTVESLKAVWAEFEPFLPFEINFMDQEIAAEYLAEQNLFKLFTSFAVLAIFIACLGLFGLVTFTAEQRKKEIGIRKVLGASIQRILGLISKDFLWLILLGFTIASPIAWYLMNTWLQDYAYKIDITPWIFIISGLAAIVIAFATIGFQSVKAALANPVDSLKSE